MEKFFKNIKPWMTTIILMLFAAFAIVRMQTTQAALITQLNLKQDEKVYNIDKENFVRELDLIHKSLARIEGKLDDAISKKP